MKNLSTEAVWKALEQVHDPEIPAVSLVEMGMIRSVWAAGERAGVVMTPTFAGCPALAVMRAEIEQRLRAAGAGQVEVRLAFSPPWSSDWISAEGRAKLKAFGLAPPPIHHGRIEAALQAPAICPHCGSEDTGLKNDFGPTLCRSLYVCRSCRQPFEQFKPL